MNEEEKKAFTLSFQNNLDNLVRNKINPTAEAIISAEMPMIYLFEDLMNKIDKQQEEIKARLKEIEKLKEDYQILKDDIEEHNVVYVDTPEFEENYISKDKIKEKIEEITSYAYTSAEERDCQDYAIQVLKELLGE